MPLCLATEKGIPRCIGCWRSCARCFSVGGSAIVYEGLDDVFEIAAKYASSIANAHASI